MSKLKICPSILAADFGQLNDQIAMLNNSACDYLHIDMMDGVFVPNISFGFPVTQAIFKQASKPMDFHLMIKDADPYLTHCVKSGAQIISVHQEACRHLHRTVSAIRDLGAKPGVVINPHTPVEALMDILPMVYLVLVMSVNPGFGGQSFIDRTYDKIHRLRALADSLNPSLEIQVDGGVSVDNATQLREAGATMLVAGSAVFKAPDPVEYIEALRNS